MNQIFNVMKNHERFMGELVIFAANTEFMKFWVLLLSIMILGASPSFAQKKKKLNQKDQNKSGLDSRKHLNKSWLDLQNGSLPALSVTFGAQAGMINLSTQEQFVELVLPFGMVAPGIQFNFNPSDIVGMHFGLQGRFTDVYYNSFGDFANNGYEYRAIGDWTHKLRSGAINYGLTFHGNLTRRSTTCTGFRLKQRSEYVHFVMEVGMVLGRSFIDNLSFVGNYTIRENGEVIDSKQDFSGVMFSSEGRRINRQMFIYAKPGFRFASGNYATRIGGFFEYQMGENIGLVNDFSPYGFSSIIYGIQLGFEFY